MDSKYTGEQIEAKLDKVLLGDFNILINLENKNRIFVYESDGRITVNPSKYSDVPINLISSFYDTNKKLGYAEFDGDITKIGNSAFLRDKNIKKIYLPKSVTKIETRAFGGSSLEYITGLDNVTEIGDSAFAETKITSIYIPSIEIIGANAFNTVAIKSINLPNTLKEIGKQAFVYSGLESIELPSSIQKIGYYVFRENKSLKYVKINCNAITEYDSSYESLDNTEIGPFTYCFYGCTLLEDVIFNTALPVIGSYAFYGCTNLKRVKLPEGLHTISKFAFSNCALSNIEFPETLLIIKNQAFWCTPGLRRIHLPKNIMTIGSGAFWPIDARDDLSRLLGYTAEVVMDTPAYEIYNGAIPNLQSYTTESNTYDSIGPFGFNSDITLYVPNKQYENYIKYYENKNYIINQKDLDSNLRRKYIIPNEDTTFNVSIKDGETVVFKGSVGSPNNKNITLNLIPKYGLHPNNVGELDETTIIIPVSPDVKLSVDIDNSNLPEGAIKVPLFWKSGSAPIVSESAARIYIFKIKCICFYDGDKISRRAIIDYEKYDF